MMLALLPVAAVLLALAVLAQRHPGQPHRAAAGIAWTHLRALLARIPLAILAAVMLAPLVPAEPVSRWLGDGSGLAGLIAATLLGALMPGGPVVAFPLVIVLEQAGAAPGPLVALITAWSALAIHRVLVFEVPMLGRHLTLVRLVASLPLAPMAGLLAQAVNRI